MVTGEILIVVVEVLADHLNVGMSEEVFEQVADCDLLTSDQ